MQQTYTRPEIWAGIECTINRLHSGYIDQLALSGHYDRPDDLDAIADLGVTALRYPVLWEKHQPDLKSSVDFCWASKQLGQLKTRGVEPIIGLLHHGSGPEFTNLLDPDFPMLLADYARKVATEFPWIEKYTPVNEPLTTSRFSGLYGLWYPHETNDVSFARMLLNQLKGIVLSMRAIRTVNPDAKLIQTEDLGKTYSTPLLKYQADWENQRRWLTFDLLCGKLSPGDQFWEHFARLGIPDSEMQFFVDNPCPPDIIGVNHYVTSERYLDQNLKRYPPHTHGGNTIHNYADVEAVRVKLKVPSGFPVLMSELWKRYKLPIAVTEAHLHCSREEQMKWFREIYYASCRLKSDGMDLRAVTAWSVLGAYGWNKLLTEPQGDYERGTFDISSGQLRSTAMVPMLRQLATTGTYDNEILNNDGWWKRESRLYASRARTWEHELPCVGQPLLIIGKTGTLGRAFSRVCNVRSLFHVIVGREDVDICNALQIENIIRTHNPWAIINAAGYVRVDDAETDCEKCDAENTLGPVLLAKACYQYKIRLMTFSSDLVFDGNKNSPYLESDAVNPLNVYGKSKAAAETGVLKANPDSLIIRTSAFFGPWDQYNFAHAVLETLTRGDCFYASDDIIAPTYVPHLVNAGLDLLLDEEKGIWHLANIGEISWFDFAKLIARHAGLDQSLIKNLTPELSAVRPKYSVLGSENGVHMPSLDRAVAEYFYELGATDKKISAVSR